MWDESDHYLYLEPETWYEQLRKLFGEATDACQRPPALCAIQQAGMYGTGASVRAFLIPRWKTTAPIKGR